MNKRIDDVLKSMKSHNITQLLITDYYSIYYLLGLKVHAGERCLALLLNNNGVAKIYLNELFYVPEELGVEKVWYNDIDNPISLILKDIDSKLTLGLEKTWSAKFVLSILEQRPEQKLVNGSIVVDEVRQIKNAAEICKMVEASKLNDLGMSLIIKEIKENITEKELAEKLRQIYLDIGADGYSFDPIVAFGKNCADTHHVPDDTPLKVGDSIIFDIGCIKDNYCADMTRTVFYKKVSEKQKKIYEIVKEANITGELMVKPGIRYCDIDLGVRKIISDDGYGKFFTHRTGHNIGLEVHEYGDVNSINTNELKSGMIFSIEPGIYLGDDFGVRIEDLVLVTDSGCLVLNQYSKELIIVG